MKKSELMKIIREEVEVVLTNEEAIEMFDLDLAALLDEMTPPSGLEERELTEPEKEELKSSEEETPKQPFIDQYGKEKGEEVYYATLTKRAKEKA